MTLLELLDIYFSCPACGGDLHLSDLAGGDGLADCLSCDSRYPIVAGIPVFLPPELMEEDLLVYFNKRHPQEARHLRGQDGGESSAAASSLADGQGGRNDLKRYQIHTWGKQYRPAGEQVSDLISYSLWERQREIPSTRATQMSGLLDRNGRSLVYGQAKKRRQDRANNAFLEIGCGEGAFTSIGSENFALYFGMDISFSAIIRCLRQYPLKNCLFFVGDAEHLPFKSGKIDLCASQWLFEHLQYPARCAAEIHRVLMPGGTIYIDTNHKAFSLTYRWFQMRFAPQRYWSRMEEAGHSHDRFFSKSDLEELLRSAGFQHIRTRLCYFLFDMLIMNRLVSPLLHALDRAPSVSQSKPKASKPAQVGTTFPQEFAAKTDFSPVQSRNDLFKSAINGGGLLAFYAMIWDRLLELAGRGESVIGLATKNLDN